MSESDRLTRIESILEQVAIQQSANTKAISTLTEHLDEVATDLHQIVADNMQSIADNNRRIDETNQKIEQLYRYLSNRNGKTPPPE